MPFVATTHRPSVYSSTFLRECSFSWMNWGGGFAGFVIKSLSWRSIDRRNTLSVFQKCQDFESDSRTPENKPEGGGGPNTAMLPYVVGGGESLALWCTAVE